MARTKGSKNKPKDFSEVFKQVDKDMPSIRARYQSRRQHEALRVEFEKKIASRKVAFVEWVKARLGLVDKVSR